MLHLEGNPISPGCASGIATICDYEVERRFELPHRAILHAEVESECKRLGKALEQSSQDLKRVQQTALSDPRLVEFAALLSAHSTMANEIAVLVKQHIGREFVNVEKALDAVIHDFVKRLQRLDHAQFRQREQDVRDVGRRIVRHLASSPSWPVEPLPSGSVIVARELLPSETIEFAKSGAVAIVSEHGGMFSHTAIVARSLGIPAFSGIPNVALQIQPGMRLLVDGETGSVVIEPSPSDEEDFITRKQEYERQLTSVAVSEKRQCPVCVCGEEAGDADFACLLVGLGVREISLSPTRAAAVRHALRHIDCHDALAVADEALHCRTPRQVRDLLERLAHPKCRTNGCSKTFLSRSESAHLLHPHLAKIRPCRSRY